MSRYVRPSGDAPEYTDALKAQVERLNAALQWEQNRSERIGTHWDGCHLAGHQHYECLLRENARLTAELADYRKALEVRNKQLGVACMKHDLVHSLACGICLTETRDLAEHWATLAEQRRVELAEVKTAVRKLAAIVMDEYPEGDERFEFAYVTKALMDGPAFCEKLNAAMKEAKP